MQRIQRQGNNCLLKNWFRIQIPFCMNLQDWTDGRIAGADSTAVTLTFALYFTLANRKIWDRLSQSIRSAFTKEDEINGTTVATIPYLTGVIYEGTLPWYFANSALRIRPVAAQGIQRDVPPEGVMIAGRFIPGGVQSNWFVTNLDQCLGADLEPYAWSPILFESRNIHPRTMDWGLRRDMCQRSHDWIPIWTMELYRQTVSPLQDKG